MDKITTKTETMAIFEPFLDATRSSTREKEVVYSVFMDTTHVLRYDNTVVIDVMDNEGNTFERQIEPRTPFVMGMLDNGKTYVSSGMVNKKGMPLDLKWTVCRNSLSSLKANAIPLEDAYKRGIL